MYEKMLPYIIDTHKMGEVYVCNYAKNQGFQNNDP